MAQAPATALPVPAVDLNTAQPLGLLARNRTEGQGEGPDMALGIARPILALAVELICRLLDYISTGRPSLLAMCVDAILQSDID